MSSKHSTQNNRVCERCGKEFHRSPSTVAKGKGRYCSLVCKYPAKIERVCATCCQPFYLQPNQVENSASLFCSRDCRYPLRLLSSEDRFFLLVGKKLDNGCILWAGSFKHKYGQFYPNAGCDPVAAHRFSYGIMVGPVPHGLNVLHRCDNPPCINPVHLFLGTQAVNMADMVCKGRQPRGEKRPNSKLTADKVVLIRRRYAAGETQKSIANDLDISPSLVAMVASGKRWKHIN